MMSKVRGGQGHFDPAKAVEDAKKVCNLHPLFPAARASRAAGALRVPPLSGPVIFRPSAEPRAGAHGSPPATLSALPLPVPAAAGPPRRPLSRRSATASRAPRPSPASTSSGAAPRRPPSPSFPFHPTHLLPPPFAVGSLRCLRSPHLIPPTHPTPQRLLRQDQGDRRRPARLRPLRPDFRPFGRLPAPRVLPAAA